MVRCTLLGLLIIGLVGCAKTTSQGETKTIVVRETINELEKEQVPGTENEVWIEPMVNVVRVPAQIDPKGVYYRLPHTTLYDIRPGKFQQVQYPDFNGQYKSPQ
jgi:hypothetical protein